MQKLNQNHLHLPVIGCPNVHCDSGVSHPGCLTSEENHGIHSVTSCCFFRFHSLQNAIKRFEKETKIKVRDNRGGHVMTLPPVLSGDRD
jgi:hypothetical protein